jgi:hypothetical protein
LAELPLPPHPPYARGIISKFERIVYGVFVFFVSKSFQNNQATSATAATAAWHSSCNLPQRHSRRSYRNCILSAIAQSQVAGRRRAQTGTSKKV